MRRASFRLAFLAIGFGALLIIAGCSSSGTPGATAYGEASRASVVNRPYTLHTSDQLRVQVYNEPTITGDYTVDSTGYLSVPVAGRIKAAGLTVDQLEQRMTAQLNGGILKDARVNIQITTYAPFYIRGEVKKPGEFPYKPGMTVGDAVALAGGFTYRADEGRVYVRPAGSNAELTRSLDTNPSVSPGDNIRVPERFL